MNIRYSILMPFLISALLCLTGQTAFTSVQVCTYSNNLGKLVADVDLEGRNPSSTGRIPLILIHGIHGTDSAVFNSINGSSAGEKKYFKNLINYFYNSDLKDKYQLYRYHYLSDQQPVTNIAAGLQGCLDSFIDKNIMRDTNVVIVAHSMGGLVARSYMKERKHTKGIYANQFGGERVEKLITLATPHHGSPGANDAPRISFLLDPVWRSTLEIIDLSYWKKDLSNLVVASSEPSRADLRFDNYNDIWGNDVYTSPNEKNGWLITLNSTTSYDEKIIAYYGYINSADILWQYLSSLNPIELFDYYLDDNLRDYVGNTLGIGRLDKCNDGSNCHEDLRAASVVMNKFYYVNNDGLVPIDSATYQRHEITLRPVWDGYDHAEMKDGKIANDPLFNTVEDDLNTTFAQLSTSTIMAAEYFIDTDPGEGNGIGMNLTGLPSDTVEFSVTTSNLTVGLHTVYIRMQNSNGLWGTPRRVKFWVAGNNFISDAEYFIDNDPGEGSGISLSVMDGAFDNEMESITGQVNTSLLSTGLHTLYVRAKDSEGHWGTPREYKFEVVQPLTITGAEYFVDIDPGKGNGFALSAVDDNFNSYIEAIQGDLNTANLYYGDHTLYVRAKDSLQRWGMVGGVNLSIAPSADFDNDGYTSDVDCNDNDPLQHPNQIWYQDVDGDGYSNGNKVIQCQRPAFYKVASELTATTGDCNDNNPAIKLGATEVCDNVDNDCDNQIDENVKNTYYRDADGDGYGNPNNSTQACSLPAGYVSNSSDCNDNNAAIKPGATEVCDNVDNDCDNQIDENVKNTYYRDADLDTYGNANDSKQVCTAPAGYVSNNSDCNDNNAAIKPGATEVCDGVDNNCNGQVDEGASKNTYYQDNDQDSYGNPNASTQACTQPAGYVSNNSDCNDGDAAIKPGATEICDGVDNNCNGQVDDGAPKNTYYQDNDQDSYGNPNASTQVCTQPAGYVSNNSDCNDNNAEINSEATEVCDGVDNNCNEQIDEGVVKNTYYRDFDGDTYGNPNDLTQACTQPAGYVSNNSDCNDNNAAINPDATEFCDGADNDCDSSTLDGSGESWIGLSCNGFDTDLCAGGTYQCTNGNKTCSDNTGNSTEGRFGSPTCSDGLDNDCDGLKDAADLDCQATCLDNDGDVNGDGAIDIKDIQACTKHIAGIEDWGSAADVNRDGTVNVSDVQTIVKIINDRDCDGILNDGDGSGTVGDNPCTGGNTTNCDDNCPLTANPDQADADNNGTGDACECSPTGLTDSNCDGGDDDCNGIADDGYVPTTTSCGVGVCAAIGQNICQSGAVLNTCTPGIPTENPEFSCNDTQDNDCDGFTDGNDTNCIISIPDLVVTYIGNLPASKKRGSSFYVMNTVKNSGGVATGRFIVRYYLSLDTNKDDSDILLKGSRTLKKIKDGRSSNGKTKVTIKKSTPPGAYYLIVCADDTNKVSESNETGNCTASNTTINVK